MKKRLFSTFIIVMIAPLVFSISVYAKSNGSKTCAAAGCNNQVEKGYDYCYFHKCQHSKCNNKAVKIHGYCSTHKCKYSGCEYCAYYTSGKYKGYCNNHAWKVSGQTTTSSSKKTYTSKKTSTSKKTYRMPDCDDYDTYEEFMDDWDGNMPDGSDAEDYWENW